MRRMCLSVCVCVQLLWLKDKSISILNDFTFGKRQASKHVTEIFYRRHLSFMSISLIPYVLDLLLPPYAELLYAFIHHHLLLLPTIPTASISTLSATQMCTRFSSITSLPNSPGPIRCWHRLSTGFFFFCSVVLRIRRPLLCYIFLPLVYKSFLFVVCSCISLRFHFICFGYIPHLTCSKWKLFPIYLSIHFCCVFLSFYFSVKLTTMCVCVLLYLCFVFLVYLLCYHRFKYSIRCDFNHILMLCVRFMLDGCENGLVWSPNDCQHPSMN